MALPTHTAEITDDFNRTDGALGANWAAGTGSSGTIAIVSNKAKKTTANAYTWYRHVTQPSDANQYSTFVMDGAGSSLCGPICRASSSGNYHYYFYGWDTGNFIGRNDNGSYTHLGEVAETLSNPCTMTITAEGTGASVTIKAYDNGTEFTGGLTDSTANRITANGYAGVFMYIANKTGDNFEAGILGEGGGGATSNFGMIMGVGT